VLVEESRELADPTKKTLEAGIDRNEKLGGLVRGEGGREGRAEGQEK
jgi:hypothetical protein